MTDPRFQPIKDDAMNLANAGLRHAEGLTAKLSLSDWKPGRSHVEQSRNSIQKLAESLLSRAEQDAKRIEELTEALQFIADGYGNQDVNHVDYRVKVYQVALDAIQRGGA